MALAIPIGAMGQVPGLGSPVVSNFGRTDYGAGTQNWAIVQDQSGIMYFGNNKGLLEYDGTNWQVYSLPNHTIIRSFAFDDKGRLFIGGQSEFGFFAAGPSGRFAYHSLSNELTEISDGFEDVWAVFVQGDAVYFCSERAVFIWNGKEMQSLLPPGGRFENFFSVAGTLYFQDKLQGLFKVVDDKLIPFVQSPDILDEWVVSILPISSGRLLISTFSAGIFLFEDGALSKWETEASSYAMEYQAYCATSLTNGNIAMGTAQNGFIVFDSRGDVLLHINRAKGLLNNTVLSIYQDRQSNLWAGLDNGIGYAEIMSPFSIIDEDKGVTGTGYTSIWQDGNLYLGTNQGLFTAPWSGNTGGDLMFKQVPNSIGQVWNLNKLSNGLVVSQHKGAAYVSESGVKTFSKIAGAWKFHELRTRPGMAIEGTYTGFVVYAEDGKSPSKWKEVAQLAGFEESARIFEEDNDGHIWVSHAYKGLYRITLSAKADSIAEIRTYSTEDGLPSELYINVARIRNELVFTTTEGIYRYNSDEDRFEAHESFNEIFGAGRNVHRLLEDEMGNIWFSIDDDFGLLEVDDSGIFANFKISYFNHLQEGLVDGFEHVYAHDASNVILGAERGFIHYNPLMAAPRDFAFVAMIRRAVSITGTDSVVYWGKGGSQGERSPDFPAKLNDFRFDFSAPYYQENNNLEYRFRLKGFDEEWSSWTSRTEKEYTNLAQGAYTFEVEARNAYGDLSEQDSYKFQINPPWYASLYARIVYVLIFILGLFVLTSYVLRREERKTDIVRKEQAEKLLQKEAEFKKEVEKSEGELVAMRNDKLQADIKHKTSQLASATMHLVQKSEMLAKLRTDLNQISESAPAGMKQQIKQVTRTIESDIQLDNSWDQFETYFDQVHENFFKRLRQKYPGLTPKDQKLCAYLRMNLSTKEIAPLLNISVRGVEISRYRVRKKLEIDSETNLVAFIMDI